MSVPSISVIIPCFNHGQYLEEAVDSVLAQTHREFEILVVDDGSTEPETRELLAAFERPRTRVERIENRGLPGARNYGIEHTEHPFVCALDADDVLEPTWFERALEVFEIEPEVAFVSHWLRTFGDQEWEWTPERCDLAALLDMNTVNGAAVVRREALTAVGLFDETMRDGCEDWDLWLRLVEQGHRGVIVPELLFRYRRRPDSMSRAMNRPPVQLGLFRRLIEQHPESYREHLLDLLLRREAGICDLEGEIFDLEREHHRWWLPELDRRRSEVRYLKERVERVRQREERRAKLDRYEHLEADLEGHRGALANAQEELGRAEARLDESQARGRELLGQLESTRGELGEARSRELALEEDREHLDRDLAGHRKALENAEAEVEGMRTRIQAELERRSDVLHHLGLDLEGHRAALENAEAELAALRADLEEKLTRLGGYEEALEDLGREIASLRGSRSWRWTAPLRRFLGGKGEGS